MIKVNRWFINTKIIHAVYTSLRQISSLIDVAVLFSVVNLTVFDKHGFINEIFHLAKLIPFDDLINSVISGICFMLNTWIVLMLAYLVADHLSKQKGYYSGLVSAIATTIILFSAPVISMVDYGDLPEFMNLQGQFFSYILIAICVGWATSWLLNHWNQHQKLVLSVEIIIVTIFSLALSIIWPMWSQTNLLAVFLQLIPNHQSLWLLLGATLSGLFTSFGFASPISLNSSGTTDVAIRQNLSYVFMHHHLTGVPYPINVHAIFETYATTGGEGMLMAVVILCLVLSKDGYIKQQSRYSFLPSLFNTASPLTLTLPIILNPILVIPLVLSTFVSCVIPIILVKLSWLPTSVYPFPVTTPGFLKGFLGTNGNWLALVVGVVNLLISIWIYLPFVKASLKELSDLEVTK